jgi:2-polyprenyl-3-methyl-5-hydroxy-6-metoxy-1,4-benzoquinol methylase
MERQGEDFIPALRYHALTSLYDPLLRWTTRESTFKEHLIRQARSRGGECVLDLGCGTGTLTLRLKQAHPDAEVVGLDADPRALRIAEAKAAAAGVGITFEQGMAFALPSPDNTFDRVLSSLLFHHLTHEDKVRTAREVARVLRPGGELHVADWGKAQNGVMRAAFLAVQILDGFATTTENIRGALPQVFAAAGFEEVRQSAQYATLFGTLALYQARKPA